MGLLSLVKTVLIFGSGVYLGVYIDQTYQIPELRPENIIEQLKSVMDQSGITEKIQEKKEKENDDS